MKRNYDDLLNIVISIFGMEKKFEDSKKLVTLEIETHFVIFLFFELILANGQKVMNEHFFVLVYLFFILNLNIRFNI